MCTFLLSGVACGWSDSALLLRSRVDGNNDDNGDCGGGGGDAVELVVTGTEGLLLVLLFVLPSASANIVGTIIVRSKT